MDERPEETPETIAREDEGGSAEPEKSPPAQQDQTEEKSSSSLATIYDSGGPPSPPGTQSPGDEDDEKAEEDEENELGGKMTFLEHLDELRKRILYSLIAVVVTFAVGWIFHEQIFNVLRFPIDQVVSELHITKPTEPFTIYLKVSFVAAIFMAIPVILAQVWLFIAPGLYRKEKAYFLPFLVCSSILFILGGAFGYFVVLPPALNFLIVEFGKDFTPIITAVEYFDFELVILIGMGAIFQLPVLVAFLSIFGLVTPGFLWRNFRYAFLLIVIAAAVISPTTDPFNLFIWSGPMVVLYMISIVVSWVFKRRRARREREDLS